MFSPEFWAVTVRCANPRPWDEDTAVHNMSYIAGNVVFDGMRIERWKAPSVAEENDRLGNGSKTVSGCDKGVTETNGGKLNKSVADYMVRPLRTEPFQTLLTAHCVESITPAPRRSRRNVGVRGESNNNRPPGLTQTNAHPGTLGLAICARLNSDLIDLCQLLYAFSNNLLYSRSTYFKFFYRNHGRLQLSQFGRPSAPRQSN